MPKKKHKIAAKNITLFLVSAGLVMVAAMVLWVSVIPLPDFESFTKRKVEESTKIYDRTGKVVLFDVHKDIKRKVVPFDDISRHIKNATVAIEDSEFYEHHGVKPTAIIRALLANLFSFDLRGQGGSTITQQVIKNTLLSNEKRLTRKIKEAVLAIRLEQALDKDRILELYLNEAPYGGTLYGVEEASFAFFGKNAKDVTLSEAAYLAALPQAPTFYSPYGSNRERLEERKNIVLDRMEELGFISTIERDTSKNERVTFNPQSEQEIKAPHFVIFIREYLENKYGADAVETQGLRVITTLDWELQKEAQEIVSRYAEENSKNYNAKNAGLIAIDPKTGQILAMVGSKNYFDMEAEGNFNITLAKRQPGSAFKPFVYATAFERGYTPETVVFDVRTQFSTACDVLGNPLPGSRLDACYTPENYDSLYRGPITFRNALAQSINVPAVKALYLAGLQESLETARDFGITTLSDVNRYGLTLVLGGGEVTLLELTSAYSVFANEGVRNPHTGIVEITDRNGIVLEKFEQKTEIAIDQNIAATINNILSDNEARTPTFGVNSPLYIPGRSVASKTGTTNDYKDAWIIGYAPNLAVGVWAGNNDNTPMEKRVAGFIVAPLWNEFMRNALVGYPNEPFRMPVPEQNQNSLKPVLRGIWQGGVSNLSSFFLGTLSPVTLYTPSGGSERVSGGVHSILYWVDKKNPQGPVPEHPEEDSQFYLWEYAVRAWAQAHGITDEEYAVPSSI